MNEPQTGGGTVEPRTQTRVLAAGMTASLVVAGIALGMALSRPTIIERVVDPGQTVWHNTTIWRNQTIYVNSSHGGGGNGSHGNDSQGDHGKCPSVPNWAPAWGLRERCSEGQAKDKGHGHGHHGEDKAKGHGKHEHGED